MPSGVRDGAGSASAPPHDSHGALAVPGPGVSTLPSGFVRFCSVATVPVPLQAKGLRCSVIGIPKTIDNDIPFFDKTFGFDTAVMVPPPPPPVPGKCSTDPRFGVPVPPLSASHSCPLSAGTLPPWPKRWPAHGQLYGNARRAVRGQNHTTR